MVVGAVPMLGGTVLVVGVVLMVVVVVGAAHVVEVLEQMWGL